MHIVECRCLGNRVVRLAAYDISRFVGCRSWNGWKRAMYNLPFGLSIICVRLGYEKGLNKCYADADLSPLVLTEAQQFATVMNVSRAGAPYGIWRHPYRFYSLEKKRNRRGIQSQP